MKLKIWLLIIIFFVAIFYLSLPVFVELYAQWWPDKKLMYTTCYINFLYAPAFCNISSKKENNKQQIEVFFSEKKFTILPSPEKDQTLAMGKYIYPRTRNVLYYIICIRYDKRMLIDYYTECIIDAKAHQAISKKSTSLGDFEYYDIKNNSINTSINEQFYLEIIGILKKNNIFPVLLKDQFDTITFK